MKIVERNVVLDEVTIRCMKRICKYYRGCYSLIDVFIKEVLKEG